MDSRYLQIAALLFLGGMSGSGPLAEMYPQDKKSLTDAEIYKLESTSKDFVIELFAAGVWKKGHAEFDLFNYYGPKEPVKIAVYDREKKEYTKIIMELTGAEYRYALVTGTAFGNYTKLDEEGKKRVNNEIFGRETRPEKDSPEHKAGVEKLRKAMLVVGGEVMTRPIENKPPPH